MRVIAGRYGSRKLETLKGTALRPSSGRLRETLFNILGSEIEGSIFIDLFAGSGAVGIEALSRGAYGVIFVENHRASTALISRNIESLGVAIEPHIVSRKTFSGAAEIIRMNAIDALQRLAEGGARVDFIFADPPYADRRAYQQIIAFLGESELLGRRGRLVLEHRRTLELPVISGHLERKRVLRQGDASLSFYTPMFAA